MSLIKKSLFLVLALLANVAQADKIVLAVAANSAPVMQSLISRFQRETGHEVAMAVGASGKFVAQIRAGAPFDIFFSADQARVQALIDSGHAQATSRVSYAQGVLLLWSAVRQQQSVQQRLQSGAFQRLALANPRLAPYGLAARQTLAALGLEDAAARRIIQGENVAQAYQFVATRNADLGFVAASQVVAPDKARAGDYWRVPQTLHAPITQDAVLLQQAVGKPAAKAFLQFVCTAPARAVFESFAYLPGPCVAADAAIQ